MLFSLLRCRGRVDWFERGRQRLTYSCCRKLTKQHAETEKIGALFGVSHAVFICPRRMIETTAWPVSFGACPQSLVICVRKGGQSIISNYDHDQDPYDYDGDEQSPVLLGRVCWSVTANNLAQGRVNCDRISGPFQQERGSPDVKGNLSQPMVADDESGLQLLRLFAISIIFRYQNFSIASRIGRTRGGGKVFRILCRERP